MSSFIARFPQAYEEWFMAGGVENNFRAHALAIGLCNPTHADIAFMDVHARTAARQFDEVTDRFLDLPDPAPAPVTPTGCAADISFYTGEIDTAFCDMLKGLGIDLVIVGLQDIGLARRQLAILQNAGFRLHAYIWPSNKDLDTYMPEVLSIMSFFKLPYIWVDVESSTINIEESITELCQHPEFRVGVYTSKFMWDLHLCGTVKYCHLPLWYAAWDGIADMSNFVHFAGWSKPLMKQYNSNNPRYDLNVYDPELVRSSGGISIEDLAADRKD